MRYLLFLHLFYLTSCENLRHTTEQCTVDLIQRRCYCRQYKFSLDYIGPLPGNFEPKEFLYCQKLVGFPDYTDTATFWDKVRRVIKDEVDEQD